MDNQSPQEENKKKLYVGNLPWSLGEPEIRDLVSQFGEIVDLKLITDRMTGRSKGFAFVEFASEEQAAAALEALNEHEIDGRKLFVKYARPMEPRENRGGGRGGFGGGRGFGGGGYRGGGDRGGYGGGQGGYGGGYNRGGGRDNRDFRGSRGGDR